MGWDVAREEEDGQITENVSPALSNEWLTTCLPVNTNNNNNGNRATAYAPRHPLSELPPRDLASKIGFGGIRGNVAEWLSYLLVH